MSWKENILFKDLSEEELSIVQNLTREENFEKDAFILREGEKGEEIYFLEEGKVSILKSDYGYQSYQINLLSAGEVFGEMALVGSNLRHASVRALDSVKVRVLLFSQLVHDHPQIAAKVSNSLNALLTSRLSDSNSTVVSSLRRDLIQTKKRTAMSNLVIKMVIIIALFQVIVQNVIEFFHLQTTFILIASLLLFFTWMSYGMIYDSGYPLKMYGITTRNWKKSVQESVLFSIPPILLLILVKYLFILYSPTYADAPLFHPSLTVPIDHAVPPNSYLAALEFVLYILLSPAQEFIFRGALQSSLQRFLTGRKRILSAILVTNLIFVQAHFHFALGFLTFIPGVFWSWLFLRHRTLIGVSVSHTLIGVWMFNIMGLRP